MRQRGIIALPLWAYVALGAALLVTVMGVALKVQSARLDSLRAEYAAFVADVKAKGDAAQKAADEREAQDKRNKERSDAEIKKLHAANVSLSVSLRDARSRGGYLPRASPGARDPDLACFSRAELESAIGRLDAGLSGIALQGDQAITAIEALKVWNQAR